MKRVILRPGSLSPVSLGVVVATLLVMLGEGAINPVLPLFARALGGSVGIVGVLIAMAGASRVLVNFPAGRAADAVGRRPLVVYGPLVTVVAALLAAAANDVWQLVVLRLLSGVGQGVFMTGSIIVLSDITDAAERLRAISLYRAAVIIGVLVGPIAGGFAAEAGGYRVAFFLQAAVCVVATVWSYLRLPAHGAPSRRSGDAREPAAWHVELRSLLANRDLVLVSLVTFNMFFMLTGARVVIIPLLGEERFQLDAGGLGLLFGLISLANLLSIWPANHLGRRFGTKPIIVVSGVLSAVSLGVFASANGASLFVVGGLLMGAGSGLASPTTASYAATVAPSDARGSAMGMYQTVGDSGFVVGPLLLGWIAASSSFVVGLAFNAALAVVVSIVFGLAATTGSRMEEAGAAE
jgi:DHA1 family multidrug resistance protein-like MFS transporter